MKIFPQIRNNSKWVVQNHNKHNYSSNHWLYISKTNICLFHSVINLHHYGAWYQTTSSVGLTMAGMSNDGLVTVDTGGCIRLWETSLSHLDQSMRRWQGLIGEAEGAPLDVRGYR